jgi:hypothetical protein
MPTPDDSVLRSDLAGLESAIAAHISASTATNNATAALAAAQVTLAAATSALQAAQTTIENDINAWVAAS